MGGQPPCLGRHPPTRLAFAPIPRDQRPEREGERPLCSTPAPVQARARVIDRGRPEGEGRAEGLAVDRGRAADGRRIGVDLAAGQAPDASRARAPSAGSPHEVPRVVVDMRDMKARTIEQVTLQVYDLLAGSSAEATHGRAPCWRSPYLSCVELYGQEWSLRALPGSRAAEVVASQLGRTPGCGALRSTICLGYTPCPPREVLRTMRELEGEWKGCTYSAQHRSCHHFADAVCAKLGVPALPDWVYGSPLSTSHEGVFLRVYDLGQTWVTKRYNSFAKSYGAFHTGVEIHGKEWSFGAAPEARRFVPEPVTWRAPSRPRQLMLEARRSQRASRCSGRPRGGPAHEAGAYSLVWPPSAPRPRRTPPRPSAATSPASVSSTASARRSTWATRPPPQQR